MSRFSVPVVVTVFLLMAFVPAAEATHEWGHRYMIFGRVVDSEGQPAQGVPVFITVETTMPRDPWLVVRTNCWGMYYSLAGSTMDPDGTVRQTHEPVGEGLELGRMHIHNDQISSRARYTVQVIRDVNTFQPFADGNDLYGEKRGQARVDMKYSTVNIQLDEALDRNDECAGQGDIADSFTVVGHAQRDEGNERSDLMTVPQANMYNEIEVTLETADGPRNMTVATNEFGDYIATFENVTVERGARVTASWNDETRESTVSDSDLTYRVSEVNVIVKEGIGGTAVKVLLYVIGALVVIGGVAFGISKIRENAETKRLRETSGRKRANR